MKKGDFKQGGLQLKGKTPFVASAGFWSRTLALACVAVALSAAILSLE